MIRCLRHESFYNSGTFVSDDAGVAVGWVSYPGSFSDCMPVWNEDKSVCLVLTGEDYQDRSGIDRIRPGRNREGTRDATYLVCLYEDLGLSFLEHINGWFSGLIVDLREQQSFLFNDRFGIGR